MLRKFSFWLLLSMSFAMMANGQNYRHVWTLQECIQYALQHNLDINQSILNKRMATLQYNQNRLSQIPSISLSGNYGKSFGRSIDPTSNQFIKQNYSFVGANGNANVLLFGWFSKRNSIKEDKLKLEASDADYQQMQNDISLNVATGYLRALLAKEQIAIAKSQTAFSKRQLKQTKAFVNAGRSPSLDLLQMKAQVADDSTAYFSAVNSYRHALLQLKALMNLDMGSDLTIESPETNDISIRLLNENTPEQIYEAAKSTFNSIKSSQLKVAAARKGLASQKGTLYPQLSFGFQAGTNFSTTQKDFLNPHITGTAPTGDFVDIAGNQYAVMQPTVAYGLQTTPFMNQLRNNFRQTAVLSLSVPIFNGWATHTAIKEAKIDVQNKLIAEKQAKIKLKQDVYGAYYDAEAAAKKYFSTKAAAESSDTALNFAQRRYRLGLISTIDLLTTQNKAFAAESNAASAKYDLIFKLKILDYYLGRPITLQ